MSCWALWQRLPLRYQLSLRESDASPDNNTSITSPHSNKSPRTLVSAGTSRECPVELSTIRTTEKEHRNPRDSTSTKRQPVFKEKRANVGQGHVSYPKREGRATMFFTVQTSPREDVTFQTSHSQTAFPSRNSPFLASFKQNQRINSARRNFLDPSTTPPASPRRSKLLQPKIQNVDVQFPVTKFESQVATNEYNTTSLQVRHGSGSNEIKSQSNTRAPTVRLKNTVHKAEIIPRSEANVSSDLSVNTLLPVNEIKPFFRNPIYCETKNHRYVLKTGQASSVLIDNDRVVVMKSASPYPHSAPSSREGSASYLAHLRRLYLKDPKDFAKANRSYGPESIKRKLLYERLEYDKRTDSILNYYSRADDVEMATAWASAVEFSRRPKTTPSNRGSRSREGSKTSRPHMSPSRSTSARTRPNSARFPLGSSNDTAPNANPPRDALEDWGEFLKINSRLALHERQFYLRTPTLDRKCITHATADNSGEKENCVCKLCQVEAETDWANFDNAILPLINENNFLKDEEHITLLAMKNESAHREQILLPSDKGKQIRDEKDIVEVCKNVDNEQEAHENPTLTNDRKSKIIVDDERSILKNLVSANQECLLQTENITDETHAIGNGQQNVGHKIGAVARVVTDSENSQLELTLVETQTEKIRNNQSQAFVGFPNKNLIVNAEAHQAPQCSSDIDGLLRTESGLESVRRDGKVAESKKGVQNVGRRIYVPSETLTPSDKTSYGDSMEVNVSVQASTHSNNQGTDVSAATDSDKEVKYIVEDDPNMITKISSDFEGAHDCTHEESRLDVLSIEKEHADKSSEKGHENKTDMMVLTEIPDKDTFGETVTVLDFKTGDLYVKFQKDTLQCKGEAIEDINLY